MPAALLKLDFNGHRLGRGKIELLQHIAETGSISKAAKKMSMSYRRAWLLVEELNQMFQQPCVETVTGGMSGGGARVTEFGKRVIAAFHKLEGRMESEIEKAFRDWA